MQEVIELLEKYGQHSKSDGCPLSYKYNAAGHKCTCGFDQALAKLREPEPTKFTKKFRELIELSKEHLSNNKIGRLQTYGKEACDIIEELESALDMAIIHKARKINNNS